MTDFINTLENEFEKGGNPKLALEQKAYLRNQFEFFGMKAADRREIQKPFLIKACLPKKTEAIEIIRFLWLKPQREFQYFSQELAFKYAKISEEKDMDLFEFMVAHKSWWDTVDYIATKLMGNYFKRFPETRKFYVDKWLKSEHLWLQRSALLFQLKYKDELDTHLMSETITALLGSKEFFINKAIGWILREYSRTNPKWVMDFTEKTALNPLSKREAIRLMI